MISFCFLKKTSVGDIPSTLVKTVGDIPSTLAKTVGDIPSTLAKVWPTDIERLTI
jgi:hypothetical protein